MHHRAKSYAILRPLQGGAANRDAKRLIESRGSQEFSATARFKNFILTHLTRIGRGSVSSVDVLLEPALFLEFRDEGNGLIGRTRAELRDDIDQRPLDILRHALGVAADVEIGSLREPRP